MEKRMLFQSQDGNIEYIIKGGRVYFSLNDICAIHFGGMSNYDHDMVFNSMVMDEYKTREGKEFFVDIDGVRQLYRRPDSRIEWGLVAELRDISDDAV